MFKNFLKKFLPPSTNTFNREVNALRTDLTEQNITQNQQLYDLHQQIVENKDLLLEVTEKVSGIHKNYAEIMHQFETVRDAINNAAQDGDLLLELKNEISGIHNEQATALHQFETMRVFGESTAREMMHRLSAQIQSLEERINGCEWQVKNEMWRYSRLFQQLLFYREAIEKGTDFSGARDAAFKSLPRAVGPQRRLQQMECYLLSQLQRICTENGLRYWVSDGTLLGAVRHDGFVPWDDDMDVSMPREDFDKLRSILNGNNTFQIVDYYCLSERRLFSKISKFVDISSGTMAFIDVFPYDFYDEPTVQEARAKYWKHRAALADDIEKLIPTLKCRYCDCMVDDQEDKAALDAVYQKHVGKLDKSGRWMGWSIEIWESEARVGFPVDSIFPCGKHPYEDLVVSVPSKPEECLRQVYGEFMLFPLDIGYQNHTSLFGLDQQDEAITAYLKRKGVMTMEGQGDKNETG